MFDVAVPEEYSNPLLFALPIVVIPEFDPVFAVPRELVAVSVSYTHLTLPTICSV